MASQQRRTTQQHEHQHDHDHTPAAAPARLAGRSSPFAVTCATKLGNLIDGRRQRPAADSDPWRVEPRHEVAVVLDAGALLASRRRCSSLELVVDVLNDGRDGPHGLELSVARGRATPCRRLTLSAQSVVLPNDQGDQLPVADSRARARVLLKHATAPLRVLGLVRLDRGTQLPPSQPRDRLWCPQTTKILELDLPPVR